MNIILKSYNYTWDENKDKLNQEKHGISFKEARDFIFEGPNILASDVAYDKGESRHAVLGKKDGQYFVGIFTMPGDNIIRIISVRRARDEEKKQAKDKGL